MKTLQSFEDDGNGEQVIKSKDTQPTDETKPIKKVLIKNKQEKIIFLGVLFALSYLINYSFIAILLNLATLWVIYFGIRMLFCVPREMANPSTPKGMRWKG